MRFLRSLLVPAAFGLAAALACGAAAQAQILQTREHVQAGSGPRIKVLSSRNDLVTGGDALVQIDATGPVIVTLNGQPVTAAFRPGLAPDTQLGLISGLRAGDNVLEARSGARASRLTLTNWPRQGPVISGPHEKPFVCMTDSFELPVTGGVLGPATGADCDAAIRVDYIYRGADKAYHPLTGAPPADVAQITDRSGARHPFIVRIETGVVNRSIYQIAILHDPRAPAPTPTARPAGWNNGLIFTFGGGCPGGMFIQGKTTGGVLDEEMLGRGFAVASSSLNVFGNSCDDLLASETMMMVKERFIEHYGPPTRTIGWGCSGGSYQAEQIGDNYPGLLDGVVVGCSFPDVAYAAVSVHSFGAKLFYHYYKTAKQTAWTDEQIIAASGLPDMASLEAQGNRTDRIDPKGVCNPAVPKGLLYDPKTNPKGARCSIYDHGINSYGRDPATGFARRPLDNVGVQYGLRALNAGQISKAQFIDLNRNIGGVDIDAQFIPQRTVGDLEAIRRAYRSGRILSTGGGLSRLPIIDYRAYADYDKGDPHQRFHSFSFRERLVQANGNADNQVLLTESNRYGLFSTRSPVLAGALDQMDAWIGAIQADGSARPARQKAIAARPAGLVDACFTREGEKIAERQVWGQETACNKLYPPHANPYIQAGAPVANNVLKCALKPVTAADYKTAFSPAELAELKAIFPTGVCDYSKPGVEQRPLQGTWLSFGPAGTATP